MRRSTLFALALYLLLRWVLATQPGYVYDVQFYKNWALFAARDGVDEIYDRTGMDYPPLYAYILYPLGRIYLAAVPGAAEALDSEQLLDSPTLTLLVKLPCIVFDLGIAALLALWVRRRELGPGTPDRWTRLLPWFYLLNPAVLFDSAYWGQPDAIHSGFLLAAFLWLGWGRSSWPSWVLLALATTMKPLGAPFFPLLAVLSLVRHGLRSTLLGGAAGVATFLLVFSPFLATGRMAATLHRIVGDVGLMAHTSSNAHNLWWALGGWRDSEAPWWGPLSATQIGLLWFGLLYLGLLLVGHRLHGRGWTLAALLPKPNPEAGVHGSQMLGLAFVLAFGFFMTSTHLHENHLFFAIPLLLPLTAVPGPRQRWVRGIFVAISIGVFLNLVLHDVDLSRPDLPRFDILTAGGASSVTNEHLHRPFFLAELWAMRVSLWWNLLLFALVLVETFRPRGWLDRLPREAPEPPPKA